MLPTGRGRCFSSTLLLPEFPPISSRAYIYPHAYTKPESRRPHGRGTALVFPGVCVMHLVSLHSSLAPKSNSLPSPLRVRISKRDGSGSPVPVPPSQDHTKAPGAKNRNPAVLDGWTNNVQSPRASARQQNSPLRLILVLSLVPLPPSQNPLPFFPITVARHSPQSSGR